MKKYSFIPLILGCAPLLLGCTADTFSGTDADPPDDAGLDHHAIVLDAGDEGAVDGATSDATPDQSDAADAGTDAPEEKAASRIAFVTTATFNANLGGASGADAKCQAAASSAGLSGTFYAWVSTTTSNPATHFTAGPGWQRTDGQPVAASMTALTSGSIANPIDLDANGSGVANAWVWTQTIANGTRSTSVDGCIDFATNQSNLEANIGSTAHSDAGWTWQSQANCDYLAHLYCFEQ